MQVIPYLSIPFVVTPTMAAVTFWATDRVRGYGRSEISGGEATDTPKSILINKVLMIAIIAFSFYALSNSFYALSKASHNFFSKLGTLNPIKYNKKVVAQLSASYTIVLGMGATLVNLCPFKMLLEGPQLIARIRTNQNHAQERNLQHPLTLENWIKVCLNPFTKVSFLDGILSKVSEKKSEMFLNWETKTAEEKKTAISQFRFYLRMIGIDDQSTEALLLVMMTGYQVRKEKGYGFGDLTLDQELQLYDQTTKQLIVNYLKRDHHPIISNEYDKQFFYLDHRFINRFKKFTQAEQEEFCSHILNPHGHVEDPEGHLVQAQRAATRLLSVKISGAWNILALA